MLSRLAIANTAEAEESTSEFEETDEVEPSYRGGAAGYVKIGSFKDENALEVWKSEKKIGEKWSP